MDLGESLTEIRKSKGISRKDFAEQLGIPYTTLRNYEKGQREPGHKLLIKMASLLSVSVDNLIGRQKETTDTKGNEAIPQEIELLVKRYRLLDDYGKEAVDSVLDVEWRRCALRDHEVSPEPEKVVYITKWFPTMPMSAGTGQPAGYDEAEELELTKRPPRGTSFVAPVSGDSMEPTYHNGDKLFIHMCEEIEPGQIGVFYMDGQQWVKELGNGVLISHNPIYAPVQICEDMKCQGLVLGVCDKSYFE